MRGRIALAPPGDKRAFGLTARLEDRLGAATAPLYRLDYRITSTATGVAITPDGAVDALQPDGQRDVEAGRNGRRRGAAAGKRGQLHLLFGHRIDRGGPCAEEDAQRRLMTILADQIVTRLIAAAPQLTP